MERQSPNETEEDNAAIAIKERFRQGGLAVFETRPAEKESQGTATATPYHAQEAQPLVSGARQLAGAGGAGAGVGERTRPNEKGFASRPRHGQVGEHWAKQHRRPASRAWCAIRTIRIMCGWARQAGASGAAKTEVRVGVRNGHRQDVLNVGCAGDRPAESPGAVLRHG
jgi:hypothetical protein